MLSNENILVSNENIFYSNENISVSNENIFYRMKIFQYQIFLLFGNHKKAEPNQETIGRG